MLTNRWRSKSRMRLTPLPKSAAATTSASGRRRLARDQRARRSGTTCARARGRSSSRPRSGSPSPCGGSPRRRAARAGSRRARPRPARRPGPARRPAGAAAPRPRPAAAASRGAARRRAVLRDEVGLDQLQAAAGADQARLDPQRDTDRDRPDEVVREPRDVHARLAHGLGEERRRRAAVLRAPVPRTARVDRRDERVAVAAEDGLHGRVRGQAQRSSLRITSRRPDHVASIAATLLSTSPVGSATSRTTSSVMSVGTLRRPLRPGDPQPSPAGAIAARSLGSAPLEVARGAVTKHDDTSACPRSCRARRVTPSGSSPSSVVEAVGRVERRSARCPGLIAELLRQRRAGVAGRAHAVARCRRAPAMTFDSWPPCQASGDAPGSSDDAARAPGIAARVVPRPRVAGARGRPRRGSATTTVGASMAARSCQRAERARARRRRCSASATASGCSWAAQALAQHASAPCRATPRARRGSP